MAAALRLLYVAPEPGAASAAASAVADAADGIEGAGTDPAGLPDRVEGGDVDCVVLEDDPPAMDSLAVLERVGAVDAAVPIVVATGGAGDGRARAALERGATDYVDSAAARESPGLLAHRVEAAVERAGAGERNGRERELERYKRIIEGVGDTLYATDAEGEFTHVNPAGERITGYDLEEILERGPELLYDESDIAAFQDAIRELLAAEDEQVARVEAEIRTKDDGVVPIESTLTLRRDEDGEFAGTIGVARDMSERLERERELREYETIVRALPDEVAILDTDGYMTRLIPPTGENTGTSGYDPDELEGEHVSTVMTEAGFEEGADLIAELVTTDRERAAFEMEIVGTGGETHWRETHLALLEDAEGDTTGTVSVLRDIEDRKARERELERYARLIEASGDAVYALDADGRFTFSNEAHQEIVDRPESEVLGEHASIALPPEAVADGEALIRELLGSDRRNGTFEMDVLRPDGERIPTENHVALLTDEDGAFRGTVGVLRDISDRRARERELERQNERLERFAEIASHDLRNPLNVAQGYLEMVRAEADAEHADRVAAALDRMERLIDDTLTMARQGATVDELTTVELAELVPDCWDAVGCESASLDVLDEIAVPADEGRLRQVLENLLRNAVEHGGEDVTVRVGAIDGEGFFLEDDGPGIPADRREAVFEAGHTTASDGTGFGLAIVAEIVDAHGWSIAVTEGAAGGARYEITGADVSA